MRERGRLVYAGAGTSGRLAVQDGAELTPTFGWPNDRLLLLIAGGRDALLQSVEGAEDDIAMRGNSSVNTEMTLTMFSWRWPPVGQRPSHWRAYVNRECEVH